MKPWITYLQRHRFQILEDWHAQFVRNAVKAEMQVVDAYLQTLDDYYLEMMELLLGGSIEEVHPNGTLSRFTRNPKPFRLFQLMEIFLSGEQVLSKRLQEGAKAGELTHAELVEALQDVTTASDALMRFYSKNFCNKCVGPLLKAQENLQQIQQQQSEAQYADRPRMEFDHEG
jgi:hypothetical protein